MVFSTQFDTYLAMGHICHVNNMIDNGTEGVNVFLSRKKYLNFSRIFFPRFDECW